MSAGGMLMDPSEVDTYLVKALQDPAVDANAKREILSKFQNSFVMCHAMRGGVRQSNIRSFG